MEGSKFNIQEPRFHNSQVQIGDDNKMKVEIHQPQTLSEAAAEIQKLLEQLSKSYPANTTEKEIANAAIKRIENNPTLSGKVISALKAGGTQALAQSLNHPAASFVIAALEDWYKKKNCK
ncbi:MAG: hypothetical protein VKL59_12120 [Nostocaceae cyanobacterium]|nr:hypothetical protein [Nostocaceae cyanobacterium]